MDLRDGYEVRYDVRNKALHYVKVAKAARRKAAVRGSNLNAAGDRSATMDDEAQDASPQRAGADVAMSSRETVSAFVDSPTRSERSGDEQPLSFAQHRA
eukprot:3480310-Pleurochrysis_carterae.AAC.2